MKSILYYFFKALAFFKIYGCNNPWSRVYWVSIPLSVICFLQPQGKREPQKKAFINRGIDSYGR